MRSWTAQNNICVSVRGKIACWGQKCHKRDTLSLSSCQQPCRCTAWANFKYYLCIPPDKYICVHCFEGRLRASNVWESHLDWHCVHFNSFVRMLLRRFKRGFRVAETNVSFRFAMWGHTTGSDSIVCDLTDCTQDLYTYSRTLRPCVWQILQYQLENATLRLYWAQTRYVVRRGSTRTRTFVVKRFHTNWTWATRCGTLNTALFYKSARSLSICFELTS